MKSITLHRRKLLGYGMTAAVASVSGLAVFLQAYKRNTLSIVEHPDSLLRNVSQPVPSVDQKIITLSDKMIATLRHKTLFDIFSNASLPRGLAAPQVGVLKRLIVCGVQGGVKVLVNPQILERRGEFLSQEGCLSLPESPRKIVKRSAYLAVQYRSLDFKKDVIEVRGSYAASMEHEIDHLNGVLYIDLPVVEG